MAGGKETPRQKMISLMYLVLMALLALNVTKEVLNAFVAIEENVQKGSILQFERGQTSIRELKEALADINPEKVKKVKYYLDIINKIDLETAKEIEEIDNLKLTLLAKSGEEVSIAKDKDIQTILWSKYSKNAPLKPSRLNLMAVAAKDQYDVPMYEIIGEDLTNITGKGKDLWQNYNKFRNTLCDLVGTYSPPNGKSWKLKSYSINEFNDNEDLSIKVDKMLAQNQYNENDDKEVIKQLYMELSKNEKYDTEELKGIHWIGKTFDHAPLVAAIASLTALQQEILTARATAVTHIKNRVSTGDYSFNKIMPLAYGPAIANRGDEIELAVMMAAFDSDNQPTITGNGGIFYPGNGQGILKTKVQGSGEMKLSGTVAIRNKSGETKTENWNHSVRIMEPQGTISLPKMNILYRGHDNELVGVASGFDETILTAISNVKLVKKGNVYYAYPQSGRTCSVAISGRNNITNKTVQLSIQSFDVINKPSPMVTLGSIRSGQKGVTASTVKYSNSLFVKYQDGILLKCTDQIKDWTINLNGHSESGSGNTLTPKAIALLKQAKPGYSLNIYGSYTSTGAPSGNFIPFSIKIE